MAKAEGISYNEKLEYPCSEESFQKCVDIISNLRDLSYEHLVIDLIKYPNNMLFIQTIRGHGSENYVIEIGIDCGKEKPQMFRLSVAKVTLEKTIEVFRDVCLNANPPDYKVWHDITREIFSKRLENVNIFKKAYEVVRDNSNEIYKGFGFKHLSDATQYYVHPDNQSFKGTTTLCQPIGEAVILFAQMLKGFMNGKSIGDYFVNKPKSRVYLDVNVPEDYQINGIVDQRIFRYRATVVNMNIFIAAYDEDNKFIDGEMDELNPLYKLLPVFMVLLGREIESNSDYRTIMDSFIDNPLTDTFVNLHEDFYQNHKMDEYDIAYADVYEDTADWNSCSSTYAIIKENKEAAAKKDENSIYAFAENVFNEEQKELIPKLSSEFVLTNNLISVCNAVSSGDVLSVLFHGPAGTGKTMSCKLICQAIGLPIMETINCTENLDEFVLGKYIPQEDKIIFKESYVTKAIREGGAVVFEEINFAKPQYLAFLNSLLDDNGFVRLDNGDMVKRHPNFRFLATMNLGYFGTKELNQALYNRFTAIVEVAALSDEAIARMLTTRVPECEPFVYKILGVYHKIKKKIEAEELDLVISPRNLENWAKLAKYDGYVKAAEKTIIPIAKCDRALEDTIRGIMMLYKWKI